MTRRPAPHPARRPRRAAATLATVAALLGAGATAAQPRTLYWRAFEVDARLDADGRLQVVETHTMVMTGSWNGGERSFTLRGSQTLRLDRVERLVDGQWVALGRGGLDRVDRFDWAARGVLRWRSRLPDDPPFEGTELVHRMAYELAPVLVADGDGYRLDHDFGMPTRAGRIERFVLDLELDPVWIAPLGSLPSRFETRDVAPGESQRFTALLSYAGSGAPSSVVRPLGCAPVALALTLSLALMVFAGFRFVRHESSRARFERPLVPATIDRAFLAQQLLAMRPEEVGALWDERIAAAEVAAVIARLVAEGKLASRVIDAGSGKKTEMALELLVGRDAFEGYERGLIDQLFFDQRTETDTAAIRAHYKSIGFQPAGLIRKGILDRLAARDELGPPPDRWRGGWPWLLLLVVVGLAITEVAIQGMGALPVLAGMLVFLPLPLVLGLTAAVVYRLDTARAGLWAPFLFVPALMLYGAAALGLVAATTSGERLGGVSLSFVGVLAVVLVPVVALRLWLRLARTRHSLARVRKRNLLRGLRDHLKTELRKPEPALDDDWLPYLLAFGLDRQVDRWASQHPPTHRQPSLSSSTPSFGSGSGGGFTGGGGRFGGAGATASWASAATAIGAGVARPGSSGSGGGSFSGGSSGGSSSGGGGGGGW